MRGDHCGGKLGSRDDPQPQSAELVDLLNDGTVTKEESEGIVIDNESSDDWMKSLPGYASEIAIHEELARKWAEKHKSDIITVVKKK